MRPLHLGTYAVALALSLSLTGCSSDSEATDDAPQLDGTPTVSSAEPEPSGSPSDDPAAEAIATSYPEVGLEFTSLPKASGAKRAALETYVAYERGLRELSRTAELNPLLTDHAAPALTPTLESTIDHLQGNDLRYDGTAAIDVSFEAFSPDAAVLTLCTDASQLRLVRSGQAEPVKGLPRAVGRVLMTSGSGAWLVTQYDTLEESC